ncbi:aldo/keto reductase [Pseudomonas cremoricolorata]|uniref:Oxidoreductase n=1 Tax=Pseudomonas cremoricolorata TaxID=157783 RepID=A0A089WPI3_9PSED|nr:aldo/keto reductase [Pseudomonas cremoricolorata]AIR91175.1 oxidoreductase [Pseudomonas cremoricolorata]
MQYMKLAGCEVPVIGQGTWYMGERAEQRAAEVAALQQGIDLGLTLIDSAEMYAEGGAEEVVGQAIAGRRDSVCLVSKVYPHNASRRGVPEACERSLKRLGTEHIDLYLLHWRGQHPLEETIEAFERLREQGKIGAWGVSNFDLADVQGLPSPDCAANQVLYNPSQRGIEFDLLPWSRAQRMPIMAYCPLAQGGRLLRHPRLQEVAESHGATVAQVCLAWATHGGGVIAIPKAVSPEHVQLNAAAGALRLTEDDVQIIDEAFAAPTHKQRLEMV